MKRVLLIAGGTVGGLGAVLSITPPQLGGNSLSTIAGASAATSLPGTTATTSAATSTKAAAVATTSATPTAKAAATKKSTTTTSSSSSTSSSNTATQSATPTATATKAAASSVSGSFTGDAVDVGYGIVQVKITVAGGKITEATAVQSPTGRSQRFSDYALPNLRQQTLTVQSAAIQGVSGASYTSYGWYKSLISALTKAGLKTGV